jgi:outer membrane protein assembly factor BamD
MVRNAFRYTAALGALALLLSSCGLRRHKYENPITKDTQQPDKVLFDTAINDIEHGRYERARLTLQTMMNAYDTSEYLAKAKLAVADSWYREGGGHGFAQAEAEYKDFILFYPNMEESAEAQMKICNMQYQQMDKADRDPMHALRAEDECRQVLVQFPNSKFAPEAQQKLRNTQEVLADAEFRVGSFYHTKGSNYAAANRLQGVTDQFPLYSRADDALWTLADAYQKMGDRFENQQAAAYSKIVRDYPLSPHVEASKDKLQAMNRPVPEADPVALARMKYEEENRTKQGMMGHALGIFAQHPDTSMAAKSGTPPMAGLRPTIPASVPASAAGGQGVSAEVSASVATDSSALDKNPDARANPPAAGGASSGTAPSGTAPAGTAPAGAATGSAPAQPAGSAAGTAAPAGGAQAASAAQTNSAQPDAGNGKNGKAKKQKKAKTPKPKPADKNQPATQPPATQQVAPDTGKQ